MRKAGIIKTVRLYNSNLKHIALTIDYGSTPR